MRLPFPAHTLQGLGGPTGHLLAATLLYSLGYQAFIPIMPLYLKHVGASPSVVGATMGIALLSYGVAQYPAGWLADHFDRRRVVGLSTLGYSLPFFLYLVPLPVLVVVPLRILHAAVGGLYTPAALALLADLSPLERVSRAYGLWQVATMLGFLLGPLLGGMVGSFGFEMVFLGAAVTCIMAALAVLRMPSPPPRVASVDSAADAPVRLWGSLLPIIAVGAAPEYLQGLYTGVWSLYLLSRGADTFQIGLSFTLFAVPGVLLSVWLGDLIDRRGPRPVMAVSLISAGLIAPVYGLVASIPLLILLPVAEGVFTAGEKPVLYSETGRRISREHQARAQGMLQMTLMGAQALGATVGGWLFSTAPLAAFLSITVACALSLLAVPLLSPALQRTG